jgi:prepilin-type N-terminal cleavage/methylation domain-containing protein
MSSKAINASMERPPLGEDNERGFSLIEMMIAVTILVIGLAGILTIQLTAMKSTSYSRHATEASVLAEDKMEQLRTMPAVSITSDTDKVDAQGNLNAAGPFSRAWTISWSGSVATIVVTVTWKEWGKDDHTVTYTTQRVQ